MVVAGNSSQKMIADFEGIPMSAEVSLLFRDKDGLTGV